MNEKLLVQPSSGDVDIIVLFNHHCSGRNILFHTGHGDSRKMIDISCPMLSQNEYHALSGIHAFSGNDYISSFFQKGKIKFGNTLMKYPEYIEVFSDLGKHTVLQEEIFTKLESFIFIKFVLRIRPE